MRSCHSGWSKNVRSCTVTTVGIGAAQRHRVVRAVPQVGIDPARELRCAGLFPHEPARSRRSARPRGRSRPARVPPTDPCRRGGRRGAVRPRAGGPGPTRARPCTRRRRPGAPEPRRRRAARASPQSRSQRCCNCRAAASRNASTCARARCLPRQGRGAPRPTISQFAIAAHRRRGRVSIASVSAVTSPGGNRSPASPTTSVSAESSAATTGAPRASASSAGSPNPS